MGSLHEIIKIIDMLTIYFVFIPYITFKIGDYFKIKKVYDHKKIVKVSVPPQYKRKYEDIQLNKIDNEELKKTILEFSKVLEDHFPEEVLTNFYNNLNELTIKNNKIITLINAGGCYLPLSNSILLLDFEAIYHELFHMASRVINTKKGVSYTGFAQKNINISQINYNAIGIALNEGYTEVLTHRYFYGKSYSSYEFETDIAKKLEIIVGADKMTEYYLRGNLLGLIDELKKYTSEDDIIKFLTRLDLISSYGANVRKIIARESIFDIYEFLLKTNSLKLKKQYEEGLINLSEFEILSNAFLASFNNKIYVGSNRYELNNISNMYNNILHDIKAPGYLSRHTNR